MGPGQVQALGQSVRTQKYSHKGSLAFKSFTKRRQADGHDAVLEVDPLVQLYEGKIRTRKVVDVVRMDHHSGNFSLEERPLLGADNSKLQLVIFFASQPEHV